MKKALLVTHVGDFVPQFEMENVYTLQNMGYEVHYGANFDLMSYGGKKKILEDSGIICHMIPFQRSPLRKENMRAYRELKSLLKANDFDLLHCHTPVGGAIARLAAAKYRNQGLKVLYTAHGFHFYKGAPLLNKILYYPAEKFLSRFTDVQITINREDYEAAKHFHMKRVIHIPGVGIDTGKLGAVTLKDREGFRRELGVEEDFCILAVGELDENKNHRAILKALQLMPEEKRKNILCLICGKGELREKLEQEALSLGVQDQVIFLGYRNDISRIYETADCFVFPSFREGLSAALMEAMAKGLPVVASKIRGNVDLIDQDQGGYFADPKAPQSFVSPILSLMNDRQGRERMGKYNREKIKSFDKAQVKEIMAQLYREVLS